MLAYLRKTLNDVSTAWEKNSFDVVSPLGGALLISEILRILTAVSKNVSGWLQCPKTAKDPHTPPHAASTAPPPAREAAGNASTPYIKQIISIKQNTGVLIFEKYCGGDLYGKCPSIFMEKNVIYISYIPIYISFFVLLNNIIYI